MDRNKRKRRGSAAARLMTWCLPPLGIEVGTELHSSCRNSVHRKRVRRGV